MFAQNDEVIYYCCTNCKIYGTMFESMTTNFEDFPYFLEEEWEFAPDDYVKEEVKEEDVVDLTKPESAWTEEDKKKIEEIFGKGQFNKGNRIWQQ